MSYVMDIVTEAQNTITKVDSVDEYPDDKIQYVVDTKSMPILVWVGTRLFH
jgi:hypothetical protein